MGFGLFGLSLFFGWIVLEAFLSDFTEPMSLFKETCFGDLASIVCLGRVFRKNRLIKNCDCKNYNPDFKDVIKHKKLDFCLICVKMKGSIFINLLFGLVHPWNYDDQPWNMGSCLEKKQSPINLQKSDSIDLVEDDLDTIEFLNSQILDREIPAEMEDPSSESQHSLRYSFVEEIGSDSVKCLQTHFHFNTSEHVINGESYFGEMHVVCYKTKYGNYDSAVESGKNDSLVVLGFHLDIKNEMNENLDLTKIIEEKEICEKNITCQFSFSVPKPSEVLGFYRYYGSLTTPDCNEQVEWTVFESKILNQMLTKYLKILLESIIKNMPTFCFFI